MNHMSDKGLISRICEQLQQLKKKKKKTQQIKMGKTWYGHFTKEDK